VPTQTDRSTRLGGTAPLSGGASFTCWLDARGEVLLARDLVGRALETRLECGERRVSELAAAGRNALRKLSIPSRDDPAAALSA